MSAFSRSRIATAIQDVVGRRREEAGLYREIADQLQLPQAGRLLDVGTGTGWQLKVIHEMRPDMQLFGLDVSQHSIRRAKANLQGLPVDLRVSGIEKTTHPDNTFDIVTCNSSMSYWDNLIECFNEIYRILKVGGAAILFEPRKGIDIDQVVKTIHANMADASRLRRFLAVNLNKYGLRFGNRLGLQLYSMQEIRDIANQSRFKDNISTEITTLQNLPIFMRIRMSRSV